MLSGIERIIRIVGACLIHKSTIKKNVDLAEKIPYILYTIFLYVFLW